MLWIRLGLKEVLKNRGFSFFFILNLSFGLAGFIALLSFGNSLNRHLDQNLKQILTADLVVAANTALTSQELVLVDQVLGKEKKSARIIQFYTMAQAGANSRLIEVRAMDDPYPLYGDFTLERGSQKEDIQAKPGVFMTRETAQTLGMATDGREPQALKLGSQSFFIQDFLQEDPDQSLTSLELAPKIYMGMDQLEKTGLMGFGSRIRYFYYYGFAPGTAVPELIGKLNQAFYDNSPGPPRINLYDTRNAGRRLERVTRHFTGYMGLVSLVALFLAGIATAYLFRGLLTGKQRELAILMSLGATGKELLLYIASQLMALGFLASVLASIMALALIPNFPRLFQGLIPSQVQVAPDPVTLILAGAMGMAGSLVFCLPVIVRMFGVKPLVLLRETPGEILINSKLALGFSLLPGVMAFFLASMLVADSPKTGMVFAGGFAVCLSVLSAMGWVVFSGCHLLSRIRNPVGKIAFRNLFRNKYSALSCFVTIAMAIFLISLIPQVQKGLENEIMRPEGLKIPVFFLVDIQEEQEPVLGKFMKGEAAYLANISPMVRGRILRVNHRPFYETAGSQNSGRSGRGRRLEFNFSYRRKLDLSETIVQGTPLTPKPWEPGVPFEISVEHSFAEQYGLGLGDLMEFEIQGILLTGEVKNVRKVRWNSFQPNFYLLFQEGVLEDAPKTFLATIAQVPFEKRQNLKNKIVAAFPNVSVIDVTQMAGTLLALSDKLALSIRFMAWLAMGAGLVSIFSIARQEARKNELQVNLLKVLGADFKKVAAITLLEFGFIGFTAALTAILLSLGASMAISWYFFDNLWQADLKVFLGILLMTPLVCILTALWASWKVVQSKPVTILANS